LLGVISCATLIPGIVLLVLLPQINLTDDRFLVYLVIGVILVCIGTVFLISTLILINFVNQSLDSLENVTLSNIHKIQKSLKPKIEVPRERRASLGGDNSEDGDSDSNGMRWPKTNSHNGRDSKISNSPPAQPKVKIIPKIIIYYSAPEDLECIHVFMRKHYSDAISFQIEKPKSDYTFNTPCILFTFIVIDEKWQEKSFWVKYAESTARNTNMHSIFVRVKSESAGDIIPLEISNTLIPIITTTTYVKNGEKKELNNEKELLDNIKNESQKLN